MPFKESKEGQTYSCNPHEWKVKKGRKRCDICGILYNKWYSMTPRERGVNPSDLFY